LLYNKSAIPFGSLWNKKMRLKDKKINLELVDYEIRIEKETA
jgi:hypothetical protein